MPIMQLSLTQSKSFFQNDIFFLVTYLESGKCQNKKKNYFINRILSDPITCAIHCSKERN